MLSLATTVCLDTAHSASIIYRCVNVQGIIIPAPDWRPQQDAFSDATVLLEFKGVGEPSTVRWSNSTETYAGVGAPMTAGFAIVIFGGEFIESYVVNAGNQELLLTMTRSGSALLPNSAKAYRGSCKPAGIETRP